MFDYQEAPDTDDMSWLFPARGPGKFKDLEEKKKQKRKKKKAKAKAKAKREQAAKN